MTESRIPLDVAEFLRDRIQTYEQLELLVRLGRNPATPQVISSLINDLNLDSDAGAAVVNELSASGLLTVTRDATGNRVQCQENVAALVGRLADVYDSDRIQLIGQMTQNALDRVRTSALRAFSSAFVLGRKRDG